MLGHDPQHYRLLAALAASGTLFALYRFLARLRRDRLVADTPPVRIRSAAQGYVKVHGRAAPVHGAPTPAPLSSRPCVWWDYEIAREERDSRAVRWRTVEKAASVELFLLVDEDAQCLVGPVGAEITPTTRSVWYGHEPRPAGPPPEFEPRLLGGPWRYTERLLSDGDRLSVMGELRSHSELGDAGAAAAQKLRQWKQDQAALLARFDANHDGRIDAGEWEAARAAAAAEARAEGLAAPIERISVIAEPANGEPFLIAPLSAEDLERRERRFAAWYFLLGLLCALTCAWALRHALTLSATP